MPSASFAPHRTRTTYNTRSNRTKLVRTPTGRLSRRRIVRVAKIPRCPISGQLLHGLKSKRTHALSRMKKSVRTVSRAYGGKYAPSVVRDRILKAFFQNEKLCVEAVMLEKARAAKAEAKKAAGKR